MERLLTAVGAAVINDEVDPILSMSVCEYAAPKIIPLLDIVRPVAFAGPLGVEDRHSIVGDLYQLAHAEY